MEIYSNNPKVPRYHALDFWRGIAALWVVMIHSCLAYISRHDTGAANEPLYALSLMGTVGVTMFFVISGYCIAGASYISINSNKKLSHYFRNRVRRIFPPYLIACCLILVLRSLIHALEKTGIIPESNVHEFPPILDPIYLISQITLTQPLFSQPHMMYVAWSLSYEVAFYFMIGGGMAIVTIPRVRDFFKADATSSINALLFTCAAITATTLVWLCFSPETCPFPLDLWWQFGMGIILFSYSAKKHGFPLSRATASLSSACLLLAFIYAFVYASSERESFILSKGGHAKACLIFFSVLFIFQFKQIHNFFVKPYRRISGFTSAIYWLGTISYSLYLIHPLITSPSNAIFRRLGLDGDLYIYNFILQIILSVFGGWLFYMIVESRFITKHKPVSADNVPMWKAKQSLT